MKVAYITHFCPHYRVRTFETLAKHHDVDYYFFSAGDEWYWQRQHGVSSGSFNYRYLNGFNFGHTRVAPGLIRVLLLGNYDVFIKCINGRFALPITYLIARLRRKPFVLWTGIWMRLQTPAHRIFFSLTRFVYRHADSIVVYGEHVKRYLLSEGVQAERIFVAPHGVDNDCFSFSVPQEKRGELLKTLDIAPGQKIVLYLGRLEQVKGLDYLLEAFARLQRDDATLVLAGIGSAEKTLRKMIDHARMASRVRFAGYVPQSEAIVYYSIASVCVLPSITLPAGKELWGLVVNEAFNQGVPVIATEAVGAVAGGLVRDGMNGLVVPERDSEALGLALERVLRDGNLRERLSANARATIAEWDNERMVLGFRQAIAFAMKGRRETIRFRTADDPSQ